MYILKPMNNGLGNRIYCIINIIYEALLNNHKISLKELFKKQNGKLKYNYNIILNIREIEKNFNNGIINEKKEVKKDLFFPKNLHLVNKRNIIVKEYFNICNKYIKPYLNPDIFKPLSEKICVIHIRSGDQFDIKQKSHPLYTQPPLNYYIKIINEYNDIYDKFIVVTEPDMMNPCIKKLKEYSSKVEIRTKSAEEDLIYFLKTKTIVLGFSTFSELAVFLSPNLQNMFFWNHIHLFSDKTVIPKNINVKSIILKKPYVKRGKSNNADKKLLKLMIDYKLEDVIFEN